MIADLGHEKRLGDLARHRCEDVIVRHGDVDRHLAVEADASAACYAGAAAALAARTRAAAEVLRTGDHPEQGLKLLLGAASLGGLMKLAAGSGLRLIPDTASVSTWFDKTIGYFGTNLSPALFGVGYIVGLNIGIVMLAGGMIAWNVAIPIYSTFFLACDPVLSAQLAGAGAEDAAYGIWSEQIRYLGVGAMLIGGVWTLISPRKSLVSGIRSGLSAESSYLPMNQSSRKRRWALGS